MAGNDPRHPHYHPVIGSKGYGVVEHAPHAGLPNRIHTHVDDPNLARSQDDMPLPPGAVTIPTSPFATRRR